MEVSSEEEMENEGEAQTKARKFLMLALATVQANGPFVRNISSSGRSYTLNITQIVSKTCRAYNGRSSCKYSHVVGFFFFFFRGAIII